MGNIKYLPNKYACYHFVKKILVKLNELYPKFEFHIVGEINYFDKFKLKRYKNVVVHGPIKKLEGIMSQVAQMSNNDLREFFGGYLIPYGYREEDIMKMPMDKLEYLFNTVMSI